jgi:L-lactate dehydrogenase complex protein LldE
VKTKPSGANIYVSNLKTDTVTLFIPCLVDSLYPEVARAVVRLLRRLGVGLTYRPEQTCCGQPAFNAGFRNQARRAARRFVRIFETADLIVSPSGSCVHMVRHHYPELFRSDPRWLARARAVGQRTYELSEYLVDVLEIVDVGAVYTGTATYHDSCHLLRGLGVREQPRQLIRNVHGLRLIEMHDSDRCCGFGGAFAVKYPRISTAMLENKIANLSATGADLLVGCDIGCLMNIHGYLHRTGSLCRTMHLAELLAGC